MSKWLIKRLQTGTWAGRWAVCPPSTDPSWPNGGAVFKTGAEALAAFAGGGE